MWITILGSLLFILIIVVLLVDLIPILKDWINRIYIGRFTDKNGWSNTITKIGISWLNKTPKIKVTDNSRLVVLDMLRGNYTKITIQNWQEASLLLGIIEYLNHNNDVEARDTILKFLNSKFDGEGQWREKPKFIDVAILAYAVMKIPFIQCDKYKQALDFTWELIRDHIGNDGTVGYRKSMETYRYVDTIGFICPFLVAYGLKYNKQECVNLAIKQIHMFEKFGMHKNSFLPFHAYNVEHKYPQGLLGWGRGLGWYAIGLIDSWGELPKEHSGKFTLEESVKKFAVTAANFQQESGCWNWTVTRKESRPDSSTTSTLAWFFLRASKIENIAQECLACTDKALDYLVKVTRRNGEIDFSQGDTKDIGVYSILFNILPFTQGFSIRTISLVEVIKLNENKRNKRIS
jgi:unsaturated rhamnogalacturonyl hydrolase